MIRYMSVNSWGDKEFKTELKKVLKSEVWFSDTRKPEVPYVKVEIIILEHEHRFKGQDGRKR